MKNLFDSDNYPTTEPTKLSAGARWAWAKPDITSAYPTDSYTLKYNFINLNDSNIKYTATASKISAAHVVEIPVATTAGYQAGDYIMQVVVIRDSDSEEVVVNEVHTEIKTHKTVSHVYKTLMAVRALIQGKATQDQSSLTINGRTLSRFSPEEWERLEQSYARKWQQEKNRLALENGRTVSNKVLIKMGA